MSVNPDKRASEDEAVAAGEEAPASPSELAPEAVVAPAPAEALPQAPVAPAADIPAELFADPIPASPPEPGAETPVAPAPESQPEPPPQPQFQAAVEPARRVREVAQPEPAPRPTPPLSIAPEPRPVRGRTVEAEPELGRSDFDAVFEARSNTGLGDRLLPTACYLLMVIGPLTLGLSAIPAAFLAYMNRQTAPKWINSHYTFQIRTFWAGTLMALIAGGTFFFFDRGVLGVVFGAVWAVIMLLGVVWFVLRSAVGLLRLRRGEAIKNARSWSI